MTSRREDVWNSMFSRAMAYVEEHHQMPAKNNREYGRILNWWKYNRRMYKQGLLDKERVEKLIKLSNMRKKHVFF